MKFSMYIVWIAYEPIPVNKDIPPTILKEASLPPSLAKYRRYFTHLLSALGLCGNFNKFPDCEAIFVVYLLFQLDWLWSNFSCTYLLSSKFRGYIICWLSLRVLRHCYHFDGAVQCKFHIYEKIKPFPSMKMEIKWETTRKGEFIVFRAFWNPKWISWEIGNYCKYRKSLKNELLTDWVTWWILIHHRKLLITENTKFSACDS